MTKDTISVPVRAAMHEESVEDAGPPPSHYRTPPAVDIRLSRIIYDDLPILEDLHLTLEAGKITCLLGPSGVGKTSIIKTIAGFLPLSDGSSMTASDGIALPGRIAYMDQQDLLLPWATVLENIVIAAHLRGQAPDTRRARQLLDRVGLAGKEDLHPAELSGGMRQRVALARTLMEDCPLVLVDEPFSAVDAITRYRLQDLAADLLQGSTVLMITHDPMEALRIGHHIYVLSGTPVLLSPDLKMSGPIPRDPTDESLRPRHDLILSMLGMRHREHPMGRDRGTPS